MNVPVKLILTPQDIGRAGGVQLNLYNVIREGLRAAESVIRSGRGVRVQWGEGETRRIDDIATLEGLERCRDSINTVVVRIHPE